MKHFSLDTGESENREINNRDDEHTEEHRISHLLACGEHDVQSLLYRELASQLMLPVGELADDVFHDDHGPINNQPEVNRAEAH